MADELLDHRLIGIFSFPIPHVFVIAEIRETLIELVDLVLIPDERACVPEGISSIIRVLRGHHGRYLPVFQWDVHGFLLE